MKQLPRGLRNNNPGNIRYSDATDWQGEVPASKKQDNAFEEFEDIVTWLSGIDQAAAELPS